VKPRIRKVCACDLWVASCGPLTAYGRDPLYAMANLRAAAYAREQKIANA
jgi:hypothetical protein